MNATNRPLNWALIILTLFFLAISVSVSAQTCTPGKDKTRLIYVNGVYNDDPGDARETRLSLGIALAREGEAPLPSEDFWNPGDGEVEDALEAMVTQTWSARLTPFVDAILAVVAPGMAPNAINEQIKAGARHRKVVEEFKARLMTLINQDGKILIVAHSQGNIVVNDALRELRQISVNLDSVGVVALASPDTIEAPVKGLYISSSQDRIIKVTSSIVAGLPANFTTDNSLNGIQNHYVVEGYLNPSITNPSGQTIRGKVVDSVRLVKESLESCGLALALTPPSASVKLGDSYQFTVISTNAGRNNATAPPPSISIVAQPTLFEVTSLSTNQGVATFSIRGLTVSTFKFNVRNDLEKTDMIGELTVTPNVDPPQPPPPVKYRVFTTSRRVCVGLACAQPSETFFSSSFDASWVLVNPADPVTGSQPQYRGRLTDYVGLISFPSKINICLDWKPGVGYLKVDCSAPLSYFDDPSGTGRISERRVIDEEARLEGEFGSDIVTTSKPDIRVVETITTTYTSRPLP